MNKYVLEIFYHYLRLQLNKYMCFKKRCAGTCRVLTGTFTLCLFIDICIVWHVWMWCTGTVVINTDVDESSCVNRNKKSCSAFLPPKYRTNAYDLCLFIDITCMRILDMCWCAVDADVNKYYERELLCESQQKKTLCSAFLPKTNTCIHFMFIYWCCLTCGLK